MAWPRLVREIGQSCLSFGGSGCDLLREREQTISHFGDGCTHGQLLNPASRDALHARVRTRQLSVNCCGGVSIVPEVGSEQRAVFEIIRVIESPERSFQALDDVAAPDNLQRLLEFVRTGCDLI